MTKGVYLIHFEPAYEHAKHYLGFAEDIDARLQAHRTGHGARLTQVAIDAGCELLLARTWPGGDRALERRLKQRKNAPALCPICRRKHYAEHAAQLHPHCEAFLSFTLADVEPIAF